MDVEVDTHEFNLNQCRKTTEVGSNHIYIRGKEDFPVRMTGWAGPLINEVFVYPFGFSPAITFFEKDGERARVTLAIGGSSSDQHCLFFFRRISFDDIQYFDKDENWKTIRDTHKIPDSMPDDALRIPIFTPRGK